MLKTSRITHIFGCFAVAMAAASYVACTDDSVVHDKPIAADGGPSPGTEGGQGLDGGPAGMNDGATPPGLDCFPNPKTHDEIINACTDAARVDKHPTLPLLQADGGLPPLP